MHLVRLGSVLRTGLFLVIGAAALADGASVKDFSGCVQGNPSGSLWDRALGWDRHDLSWAQCAPEPGAWNQEYLDQWGRRILEARKRGAKVLPILAYNASWSWDRGPRTFEHGNTRRQVTPLEDGRFRIVAFRREETGSWVPTQETECSGGGMFPLAEAHVGDWEDFVRRVVSFLRESPYEVEYFEIWNEAHPDSGFWVGGMDEYMKRIHLPAARIIRELGGKVVYGGYPVCGSIENYVALLDKHQAWHTLDVLCVHYFGLGSMEVLRAQAAQRGFDTMGVWQTEVGFTDNPAYVSNVYPRAFYWALTNGLEDAPDRYKLFYFAFWSPNDPKAFGYGKTLHSGETLSEHGQSLRVLSDLFGDEPVRPFDGVRTEPDLSFQRAETQSSVEAFACGSRIVVAVHWISEDVADTDSIGIALDTVSRQRVARIRRCSVTGTSVELPLAEGDGVHARVIAPVVAEGDVVGTRWWGFEGEIRTFYVEFEAR